MMSQGTLKWSLCLDVPWSFSPSITWRALKAQGLVGWGGGGATLVECASSGPAAPVTATWSLLASGPQPWPIPKRELFLCKLGRRVRPAIPPNVWSIESCFENTLSVLAPSSLFQLLTRTGLGGGVYIQSWAFILEETIFSGLCANLAGCSHFLFFFQRQFFDWWILYLYQSLDSIALIFFFSVLVLVFFVIFLLWLYSYWDLPDTPNIVCYICMQCTSVVFILNCVIGQNGFSLEMWLSVLKRKSKLSLIVGKNKA